MFCGEVEHDSISHFARWFPITPQPFDDELPSLLLHSARHSYEQFVARNVFRIELGLRERAMTIVVAPEI